MAVFLCNAFSLQMLQGEDAADLHVRRLEAAPAIGADVRCCIGHADTAAVVGRLICLPLQANRENVALQPGDILYVAQLMGGRLPEGATTLPEGFEITWFEVTLRPPHQGQVSFLGAGGLDTSLTLTQTDGNLPAATLRHQVCRRGRFLPETREEISLARAARMILDLAERAEARLAAAPSFEGVTVDGLTVRDGALVDEYGNYLCPIPPVGSVEELTEWIRGLEAPE